MKLGPFQKAAIGMLSILIIITACNNQSDETPVSVSDNADLPSSNSNVKFIPYDTPPEPIGGFMAIQKNVIYPEADREAGHEGTAVVQAFVDENGAVTEAVILRSAGMESLDEAALNAIKQTEFKPAMQKEKPVGVYISIPVLFKLDKDKD